MSRNYPSQIAATMESKENEQSQLRGQETGQTPPPERRDSYRWRPAVVSFAVLAACLAPVAVLPYVFMRLRISRLHRRISKLSVETTALQKSFKASMLESALRKEELSRTTAVLDNVIKGVADLRRDIEQSRAEDSASNILVESKIQKLMDEVQSNRLQLAMLQRVGMSLADIAAFMHEVELHHGLPSTGMDDHGIERIRMLALQLQKLPSPDNVEKLAV